MNKIPRYFFLVITACNFIFTHNCLAAKVEFFKTSGVSFEKCKFGQGALADNPNEMVIIPVAEKINKTAGTVELWIRTKFSLKESDLPVDYPFLFSICNNNIAQQPLPPTMGLHFLSPGRIAFQIFIAPNPQKQHIIAGPVLDWDAGEDHYLAAAWGRQGMKLFIDGQKVAENNYALGLEHILNKDVVIGNHAGSPLMLYGNTLIDELRISRRERTAQELNAAYSAKQGFTADAATVLSESFDNPEKFSVIDITVKNKTSPVEWERIKSRARFKTFSNWAEPKNLGVPANSLGWEDSAYIAPDGQTIYFSYLGYDMFNMFYAREKKYIPIGPMRGFQREKIDILACVKNSLGQWQEAKVLEFCRPDFNEFGAVLGRGGNRLYFSADYQRGFGENDLWFCDFARGKWGEAKNIGAPINSPYEEQDPHISSDGNEIYFWSNDRPGGLGGEDIWYCRKTADVWSEPVNIGPPINTSGNELQPFLAEDAATLYFTSDRNGYAAIYYSERDKQGHWSKPRLVIAPDGGTGVIGIGEPTLTRDGKYLYCIAVYKSDQDEYDADILASERKE